MLKFGSLFTGIGGLDMGLERAGMSCMWQVEIDEFCRSILELRWRNVRRFVDVHFVGKDQLEPVDLICGGFPCQDISQAGKKKGLAGHRSGLWREFRRIVSEVSPRFVLIENNHHRWRSWVPAVRRELWEIGYASLPLRLRACDFGALHERARCFIVADRDRRVLRLESWRRSWENGPGALWARDAGAERPAPSNADGVWELQPEGCEPEQWRWPSDFARWPAEPNVARVVHGLPGRMDRIKGLGNAVVPIEAEWIGRTIVDNDRI